MRADYFGLFFLLLTLSVSCTPEDEVEEDLVVEGMKPVYISQERLRQIEIGEPREIDRATKIYIYQEHILIGDNNTGFHVMDNSNPTNPITTHFISIPASSDVAIRNDILYANNGNDLIAMDFGSLDDVVLYDRLPNVFNQNLEGAEYYPALYTGYFECVDPEKGVVTGWVLDSLVNPKCIR